METFYWVKPTQEDLDALGDDVHTPDDFQEPITEVYRESWEPIMLYASLARQWRHGFNGPYALDFNVFQHTLDRKGVTGQSYDRMMRALTDIESAALEIFHRK